MEAIAYLYFSWLIDDPVVNFLGGGSVIPDLMGYENFPKPHCSVKTKEYFNTFLCFHRVMIFTHKFTNCPQKHSDILKLRNRIRFYSTNRRSQSDILANTGERFLPFIYMKHLQYKLVL